jgi:rare lipoprotein A
VRGAGRAAIAAATLLTAAAGCASRREPATTPEPPQPPSLPAPHSEPPPAPDPQPAPAPPAARPQPEPEPALSGEASWYGPGFHGRKTASGERYDQEELTAAHPTLPFGTRVRVTLLETGRSVIVRINDRGPTTDKIIDLSRAAARALGMIEPGVGAVRLEVLPSDGEP